MNQFDGLHTVSSCAGHEYQTEEHPMTDALGSVAFIVDSQASLTHFLSTLPFIGHRASIIGNQFQAKALSVTATLSNEQVIYDLQIHGEPFWIQRALIGEIERSLATALSPAKRLSCPRYDSAYTLGT